MRLQQVIGSIGASGGSMRLQQVIGSIESTGAGSSPACIGHTRFALLNSDAVWIVGVNVAFWRHVVDTSALWMAESYCSVQ